MKPNNDLLGLGLCTRGGAGRSLSTCGHPFVPYGDPVVYEWVRRYTANTRDTMHLFVTRAMHTEWLLRESPLGEPLLRGIGAISMCGDPQPFPGFDAAERPLKRARDEALRFYLRPYNSHAVRSVAAALHGVGTRTLTVL